MGYTVSAAIESFTFCIHAGCCDTPLPWPGLVFKLAGTYANTLLGWLLSQNIFFSVACCKFVFNCGGSCCGTLAVVAVFWFQLDGSVETPAALLYALGGGGCMTGAVN